MSKVDALQEISDLWSDKGASLYKKATGISSTFSREGLDLAGTAAFIDATPSELAALLALSNLEDEQLREVSDNKLPITTWVMLADASDEEFRAAMNAYREDGANGIRRSGSESSGEHLYRVMVDAAGPTPLQAVGGLSASTIAAMRKRGEQYKALTDWEVKFLKSIASRRGRGTILTEKQANRLLIILSGMADKEIIVRNCIDSDKADCNATLDALGR